MVAALSEQHEPPHTHGPHVYPGIIVPPSGNDPGFYGDYVVDDPAQGIQPGETRQYEYRIREDHPAGTYWYQPHMHGSSAMQVGSGMAGALIITGPIDRVPEIAAAPATPSPDSTHRVATNKAIDDRTSATAANPVAIQMRILSRRSRRR